VDQVVVEPLERLKFKLAVFVHQLFEALLVRLFFLDFADLGQTNFF
jgi:hypothetical protein